MGPLRDESAPEGTEGLWSDYLWFPICEREADVFGVNHSHATNKSYGCAEYSITPPFPRFRC